MTKGAWRFALIGVLVGLAACAGGDTPSAPATPLAPVVPPPPPAPVPPGTLELVITGLPPGTNADVAVVGGTFTRSATGTVNWTDVPAGQYSISVRPVRTTDGTYVPSPSALTVTVRSGSTPATAAIAYAPVPSSIDLTITGVPSGIDAPVIVTAPAVGDIAVPSSRVVSSPSPGRWRVASALLRSGSVRYAPSPPTLDTIVLFGDTARLTVRYEVASGALAVVVAGLPPGLAGAVQVTGPEGFSSTVTTTSTLTGLTPGIYRLVAAAVASGGISFRPAADTVNVTVSASLVAAPATVTYVAQVGRVVVSTSGLPPNAVPVMTLTGDAVTRGLSGASSLDSIPAGTYTLSAAPLTAAGVRYAPAPASQRLTVTTGNTTTTNVGYAALPTVVEVPVSGLPTGAAANITLISPAGDTSAVSSTTRVSPAAAGRWRLTAGNVTSGGAAYQPTPTSRDTTVSAGDTLRLPVQYRLTTGAIALVVSGLPAGSAATVLVIGPGGYQQNVANTTTLTLLTPGAYTITAGSVLAGGTSYLPQPISQTVTVVPSLVATPATVSYGLATGSVTIATTGLPVGLTPTFSFVGAGSPRTATGAGTVSALTVGSWTITANAVVSGATTYTPSPSSAQVSITPNATSTVTFAYSAPAGSNYAVTNVYLTQAIQRLDNTVALVAGRDALLRVFVLANGPNTATPDVRVRIFDGATLLQSATITAPEPGVRTTMAEGTLSSTWNLLVPGVNIRPTTRVLVDLDPGLTLPDTDRSDNTWPVNGIAHLVNARTVPTFTVRFVPIVTGTLTGDVTTANRASFLSSVQRMFPLNTVVSDVRAPFTSTATTIQSDDGNGQWRTVLSEINALRTLDGAPSTMHYYGVLKVSYTSGVAGYGFVPGRAAIGWDYLPSGDRVAAHEWGHNFSRDHAPCGTFGDASYPYAGGVINFWGWNSLSNTLVSPTATDVMGYCSNQWISDYNWSAIMQYRSTSGTVAAAGAPADGLLIWGRVVNGVPQLEPAFRVNAPISATVTSAAHRLALLDADGTTLLDTPLQTQRVDHANASAEQQFAVVVPWTSTLEDRLATITVQNARLPILAASRRSARQAPATSRARVDRMANDRARVTWNSADYPMAMVRDAATGALMGFVRRSGDAIATGGRAVDVVYSDGVRTVRP